MTRATRPRVLVGAWVGSGNLGDELVFAAVHRKLEARGAEVVAVSADPDGTRRLHGVSAVSHANPVTLAHACGDSSALVWGGGGLLQDQTSPWNLPYHLTRIWLSRLRRTPFAVVGVGAGRLDGALGRELVRRSLRAADGISVRDRASAELLVAVGVDGAVVAADPALSLPQPARVAEDAIVACLRPLPRRRLLPVATRGRSAGMSEAMIRAVAHALDGACRATGLAVRFVAFHAERDHRLHERIAARMRSPAEAIRPGLSDILDEVARGRVVVALRYHAGIAALLAGRPVVLVDHSPKMRALAEDVGRGAVRLPYEEAAWAHLPDALEVALAGADAVGDARSRLIVRERSNDDIIDDLLAST